jgi:Leucine-rich repeat (LRR) protein
MSSQNQASFNLDCSTTVTTISNVPTSTNNNNASSNSDINSTGSHSETALPTHGTVLSTVYEGNDDSVPTMYTVDGGSSIQMIENATISSVQQQHRMRCRSTFSLALIFVAFSLVAIAAGLGVYCGLGNCTTSDSGISTTDPTNESGAPTIVPPDGSGAPTIAPPGDSGAPTINLPGGTVAPTIDFSMMLLDFINNITVSSQKITFNGTNPESKALNGMLENVELFNIATSLDSFANNTASFRVSQLYPLLILWFQQTETAVWTNVDGWFVDGNECDWYGVSCQAFDLGDSTGTQNVVTRIVFYDNNYRGIIPPDLALLTMLEHFDFGSNFISGTLPESIGLWTSVIYFDAHNNSLKGTLPESIGLWTSLTRLDVSSNALSGTLPESIGQWAVLASFHVGSNTLTGTLPASIGQFTALTNFSVLDNALTGTLPTSIGQWTLLTYFDVNLNALVGTLPESIGLWTSVIYFDAHNNSLTGTLPASIGQWTSLTRLDVSSNALSGTIPVSVGNWTQIEYAAFEDNQFTGILLTTGICANVNVTLSADCLSEIRCGDLDEFLRGP